MNANSADLLSLHKAYNDCLKVQMNAWVAGPASASNVEWCPTEKAAYFNCMKDKKPTEYQNMMRLEDGNF
jgi:hypothetical protein